MKEDLIADIWTLVVERIPEKYRETTAGEFVNTLLDYGVKESTLESLLGVDDYLDDAINYAIDGSEMEDYDHDNYEDEE